MKKGFQGLFGKSRTSSCLLGSGKVVLYQNRSCRELCGNYTGTVCPESCARACGLGQTRAQAGERIRFFPNTRIGTARFDALFLDQSSRRMVLLQPLADKHEKLLLQFQTKGLTRREMAVVELGLQGRTNTGIQRELGITQATLKTHLNNIYRKVPEAREWNWRGKA